MLTETYAAEIFRCCLPTAFRPKYDDNICDALLNLLVTVELSGSVIRTGGNSEPGCGGSANTANPASSGTESASRSALPVSTSMSAYARSPTRPLGVSFLAQAARPSWT